MKRTLRILAVAWIPMVTACGHGDSGGSPPPSAGQTGASCSVPTQCYPGLDAATLRGTADCLTNVPGGYCTHQCSVDSDCCAVPGECRTALVEVCSPFESLPGQMCFLSCEDADLARAENQGVWPVSSDASPSAYCRYFASPNFGCRASGGGSANRKICLP
jgi:hypothetical protein